MTLADVIHIELGGEVVTLHPSLACAMKLEARPGSFRQLLREITEGSLTAACEIIAPHHPHPFLAQRVFDAGLGQLAAPLTDYVLLCAGVDPSPAAADNDNDKGEQVPIGKFLEDLFRYGSGWLAWTPDETLNATPLQIRRAVEGRTAMLKAIFGNGEKPKDTRPLADKARAFFVQYEANRAALNQRAS